VLAATICNDTSRKLVLAYRLGGPIALARLLAQLIALRLPDRVAGAAQTVLVPDQVAFVGGELTRLGKGEPAFDALLRPRRTPSLVGFGREARERVLSGAIRLNPALLSGHAVVLVDKVLTSGATSSACIAAIAVARPSAISVTCFARVERTAIQSLPTPILALRGARKT
jgi:predicted amidophosphoribosyltransferase